MEKTAATTNAVATATVTTTTGHPSWQDKLMDYVISHSGALLSALAIIIVGALVARWLGRLVGSWCERKKMEPPVRMLLTRIVKLLVFVSAMVVALGTAGMDVTVLIAGFSVAGVGVGLALQGVLGNLFAGLTIIFTKPFRVGEYIELLSVQGQVSTIELLSTTLIHPDRSRVVIPNRKIVGEILHNYGSIRQLSLTVGVGYGTNLNDALIAIGQILQNNPRVLKDPPPVVGINGLGNSSINIFVGPWVMVPDFGPAGAEIYQSIVADFRERRIEIPFPQHEVRLLNAAQESQ
jgi:small conductance mechanosensitive channel